MREWHAAHQPDFAAAHPLRPSILAGLLSLVLFAVSAGIMLRLVVPLLAPARFVPPALFALGLMVVWAGLGLVMLVRRPGAQERVQLWGLAARGVIYGGHIACIWLIWGVLPDCPMPVQLAAMLFFTAYVPAQIIGSPENVTANRAGIVTVLGSAVLFLATRGVAEESMLALYLAVLALLMFVLSDQVRGTINTTVTARLASDDTARKLERLLEALAAEKEAKTRFILAASHDLGQPLQAAALFFDQTLRAPTEPARAQAVQGVQRAFASAEQLLSHMLNHLRLEADAVEPVFSRVTLSALLQRVAAQHGPAAQAAGIELRVRTCGVVALLDPVLMERAMSNLVHNAIHHSRGSRVLLAVRRHRSGVLRIWVIDNGGGISPADAKHIFEEYYQGLPVAAVARVGFGLGLASVRRIAALLGGMAGHEPRWRRGAAFYLEFPPGLCVTDLRGAGLADHQPADHQPQEVG